MNQEELKKFNIELQALLIKYDVRLNVEAKIVVTPNKPMEETIPEVVEAPVEVVETQEEVSDAAPESTEEVVA